MFKIKLNTFEGPLDLLLFFIKRDELDIYDIPISHITREFLGYIEIIRNLDLEQAGDFILLASTLMHIKAKMLLPREVDPKGEEIDPRTELVQKLVEYKKYKEMAEELSFMETNRLKISMRGNFTADPKDHFDDIKILLKNVSVFDLAKAYKKAVETVKVAPPIHQIRKIPFTLEGQMDYILTKVSDAKRINFIELVLDLREKIQFVFTFIGMLELIKMQKIGLHESEELNDFEIYLLEEENLFNNG